MAQSPEVQSLRAQSAEGDLGGPADRAYGPWSGTGLNAGGDEEKAPYPSLDVEGHDMDGFAAQWDQVAAAFDPLYRALTEASTALSELLAFEWDGQAGEATRAAALKLKTAIDSVLSVGSENGLADLLNTAHAQRRDWEGKSADFSKLELINTVLLVAGFALAFIPLPVGALINGVSRAVTAAVRVIPGATRAGAAIGGVTGRVVPAALRRGVGAVTGTRTGSIVADTATRAVSEYAISVSFESIYRRALLEEFGIEPNYGDGALIALGAPIGATVWLTRLPKRFDRALTDTPVFKDIGLGAAAGVSTPIGYGIAYGETGAILWAGLAAGGLSGALSTSTRQLIRRWRGSSGSAQWRASMRTQLERENIPGFTNQLLDGIIPPGFGSSLKGTQKGAAAHLAASRTADRDATTALDAASAARQRHWDADELGNRARELRRDADAVRESDPDAAAVQLTAARRLDDQAGTARAEARAMAGSRSTAEAQSAHTAATVAAGDATLRRQVWEVVDTHGVDIMYTLVAQSRRLGYVFEAAYKVPISLGTKAWLKVLVTTVLGQTPAELTSAAAVADFEARYGEVPDVDPALLEEMGFPVPGSAPEPGPETVPGPVSEPERGDDAGLVVIQAELREVGVDLAVLADRVNVLLEQAERDPLLTTIQKVYLTDLRDRLTTLQAEVTEAQNDVARGRRVAEGGLTTFDDRADELRTEVDALGADLQTA